MGNYEGSFDSSVALVIFLNFSIHEIYKTIGPLALLHA